MDRVEEAVAAQLDDELAEQRLSVDYLACPEWRHPSSQHETCRGYVEGVVVDVEVWLHGPADNRVFDARLGSGVLATANLVDRLVAAGYHRVDCGDRPAYPTVVGDRIICAVTRDGLRSFVVATVTTGDGEVAISDY